MAGWASWGGGWSPASAMSPATKIRSWPSIRRSRPARIRPPRPCGSPQCGTAGGRGARADGGRGGAGAPEGGGRAAGGRPQVVGAGRGAVGGGVLRGGRVEGVGLAGPEPGALLAGDRADREGHVARVEPAGRHLVQ